MSQHIDSRGYGSANEEHLSFVWEAGENCADVFKKAHRKHFVSFVKDNVTSGNNATVYFEGTNDDLTSLTPGTTYVLSHTTPGLVLALASGTTTAGHSLQVLGVAISATAINTEIAKPIIRG